MTVTHSVQTGVTPMITVEASPLAAGARVLTKGIVTVDVMVTQLSHGAELAV